MRTKAIPFLGTLLLAVSGCDKTTNSSPSQSVDPAIARGQAQTLTIGTTQTGSLRKGEIDWFKFAVDSGRTYILQQSCPQDPCPEARTIDVHWKSDDSAFGSSDGGLLRFTAVKTDSVFLSIEGSAISNGVVRTSFGYWDSVNYSVALSEKNVTSPDAVNPGISAVTLIADESVTTRILKASQTLWYKFRVDSGASYTIQRNCPNAPCPGYTTFRLFPDSTGLAFDSSTGGTLNFTAAKAGTVYLSIVDTETQNNKLLSSFNYWDSVNCSIYLKSSSPQIRQNQSDTFGISRARTLSTDGTLHFSVLYPGEDVLSIFGHYTKATQSDWFRFPIDSGMDYTFDAAYAGSDWNILEFSIFPDGSGLPIWEGSQPEGNCYKAPKYRATRTFVALLCLRVVAKTYWQEHYALANKDSLPYSIQVSKARSMYYGATAGSPAQLLTTDGWPGLASDAQAYFKVPVKRDSIYQITTGCDPQGSEPTWCGHKFRYSSREEIPSGFFRSDRDDTVSIELNIPYRSGMVCGQPTVQVAVLERTDIVPEAMSSATDLVVGNPDIGKTASSITENWFRFHADSGKTYSINHTANSTNTLVTSFWNVDSAKLTESVARPSASRSEFVCQKSGTYFYKVTSSSILKYSTALMSTDRLPTWYSGLDEYEPDSTMRTASTISVDAAPVNHTLTRNDVDWIRFHTATGKAYGIQLLSSQNCSLAVYSADSIQQTVGDSYLGARVFIPASGADFYLRVSTNSDSASYGVQVTTLSDDEYERDETRETAKELYTTGTTQDRTLSGTHDVIKFRVQAGKKYWARIVNNTTHCIEARTLLDALSSSASGSGCLWGVQYLPATAIADTFAYLQIHDKDPSESTPYSISVVPEFVDSFESDNSLSTAKSILTDGIFQHRSIAVGDQDWISFEVDSGATYRIEATAAWDSEPINMDLFSADSAQLGDQVSSPAPTMMITGRRRTTYFIRITTPVPTSSSPNLPTSFNYSINVRKQ